MTESYRYRAYDLLVESELELPELLPSDDVDSDPDLRVRIGGVPEVIDAPAAERVTWAGRPGAWLHQIEGVARFYVCDDGREVRIEPGGGDAKDIRAFLFGTTLGAIFHQRRQFVLHASAAVGPGGGAVVVAGPSGTGKSTTLSALAERGFAMLSDDKTVVRFGDGGPSVLSGYPTVRLWGDAVRRLGYEPDALARLREGTSKFLYSPPGFQREAAPLRAIVVLHRQREGERDPETGEVWKRLQVDRLDIHASVGVVLHQTYRRRILDGEGLRADHFRWATQLATAVPIVRIVRPRHAESVPAVVGAIEAVLADAVAQTS